MAHSRDVVRALLVALVVAIPARVGAQEAEVEEAETEAAVAEEPVDEAAAEEEAAEDEGGSRWFHLSALAIRANPLGLRLSSDTGYRIALSDSESLLLKDTHLNLGLATDISPAFVWGGPFVEIVPLAIIVLRASFKPMFYFGTFGAIADLGGVDADWSPERIDQIEEDNLDESATGMQLSTKATLQARVGRVVARGESQYDFIWMDVDHAYYEPTYDLLLDHDDRIWTVTGMAGYLIGADLSRWFLLLGARWEHVLTVETDVLRDVASFIWIWKVPTDWISFGELRWIGLAGLYINDVYLKDEVYFATQFTLAL